MKKRRRTAIIFTLTCAAVLFALFPPVGQAAFRKGFFLGLSGHPLDFQGDLNGTLTLWHIDKAYYLPQLDKTTALGIGFGRRQATWLWEIAFVKSSQKAHFQDMESSSDFQSLEINGKNFLFIDSPVRPYYLVGISVPWLKVGNGSELDGVRADATYIGIAANFGAGLTVGLGSSIFISGGAMYRLAGFFYVSGGGPGRDIAKLQTYQGGPEAGKWLQTSSLGLVFSLDIVLN